MVSGRLGSAIGRSWHIERPMNRRFRGLRSESAEGSSLASAEKCSLHQLAHGIQRKLHGGDGRFAKGTLCEEAIQLLHVGAPTINVADWSPARICDLIKAVEAESQCAFQAESDQETL
jgi:hypothetical protein